MLGSGFPPRLPAPAPVPAAAPGSRRPAASQDVTEPALRALAAPFLLLRELHPPPGKRRSSVPPVKAAEEKAEFVGGEEGEGE